MRIVLPSAPVKSVSTAALFVALALASCSLEDGDERRAAWSEVQRLKAAYHGAEPSERVAAKQNWADGVRQFLEIWPDHPGATRTWNDLQLDYAEQLEANGHFAEAARHYESLLQRVATHPRAIEGLQRLRRRQSLSSADLAALRKGMTSSEVAAYLGLPRPGWDRSEIRDGRPVESWYYRDATGTVRGVHFREGVVFEVDVD